MAGYLDQYGAGDERRERIAKKIIGSILAVLVLGTTSYLYFENFGAERKTNAFLTAMKSKEYRAAYATWGCTEATPCKDYSFQNFMEDWGPQSRHADVSGLAIADAHSCGSGVLVHLKRGGRLDDALWVEAGAVGFAPWQDCQYIRDWTHVPRIMVESIKQRLHHP